MKKIPAAVIALLIAISFIVAGNADAKSVKKAKQEAAVAKQEAKTAEYEAKTAKYEANAAEENSRKKKAKKK